MSLEFIILEHSALVWISFHRGMFLCQFGKTCWIADVRKAFDRCISFHAMFQNFSGSSRRSYNFLIWYFKNLFILVVFPLSALISMSGRMCFSIPASSRAGLFMSLYIRILNCPQFGINDQLDPRIFLVLFGALFICLFIILALKLASNDLISDFKRGFFMVY